MAKGFIYLRRTEVEARIALAGGEYNTFQLTDSSVARRGFQNFLDRPVPIGLRSANMVAEPATYDFNSEPWGYIFLSSTSNGNNISMSIYASPKQNRFLRVNALSYQAEGTWVDSLTF